MTNFKNNIKNLLFYLIGLLFFGLGRTSLATDVDCKALYEDQNIKTNFVENYSDYIKCGYFGNFTFKITPSEDYTLTERFEITGTDRILLLDKTGNAWLYKNLDKTKNYTIDLYNVKDKSNNVKDFGIKVAENGNVNIDIKSSNTNTLPMFDVKDIIIVTLDETKPENIKILYSSQKKGKSGEITVSGINSTEWYQSDGTCNGNECKRSYYYNWYLGEPNNGKIEKIILNIYYDFDNNGVAEDSDLVYTTTYTLPNPLDVSDATAIFDTSLKNIDIATLTRLKFTDGIKLTRLKYYSDVIDGTFFIKGIKEEILLPPEVAAAFGAGQYPNSCIDLGNMGIETNGFYKIYPFLGSSANVWLGKGLKGGEQSIGIKEDNNGVKLWVDDTYAKDCSGYKFPDDGTHVYAGYVGNGWYWVKTNNKKIKVYCDMTTDGGGWTLVSKIKTGSNQWYYDSNNWTSNTTINESNISDISSDEDYKNDVFNYNVQDQVRFCMGEKNNCLVEDINNKILKDIFSNKLNFTTGKDYRELINVSGLSAKQLNPSGNQRVGFNIGQPQYSGTGTTELQWSGNNGADGRGHVWVGTWTDSRYPNIYFTFKTVGGARDPSIHHIVITRGGYPTHNYSTNTDNDYDRYQNAEILGAIVYWGSNHNINADYIKNRINLSFDGNGKLTNISISSTSGFYSESFSTLSSYISDGGRDTYDNGNYMRINNGSNFTYSTHLNNYGTGYMTFIFPQRIILGVNGKIKYGYYDETRNHYIGLGQKINISSGMYVNNIKYQRQGWIWTRKKPSSKYNGVIVYCDFTTPGGPYGFKAIDNGKTIRYGTDSNSCQDYGLELYAPTNWHMTYAKRNFLYNIINNSGQGQSASNYGAIGIYNTNGAQGSGWDRYKEMVSWNNKISNGWVSKLGNTVQWYLLQTNKIREPNGDYYKNALLGTWFDGNYNFLRHYNDRNNSYTFNYYVCVDKKIANKYNYTSDEAQNVSYKSCKEIKNTDPDSKDGYYWIKPDGVKNNNPVKVYCDMTTDGGGWTMIDVKTRNYGSDFYDELNDMGIKYSEIMLEDIDHLTLFDQNNRNSSWDLKNIPYYVLQFKDNTGKRYMVGQRYGSSNWNSNPWRGCNNTNPDYFIPFNNVKLVKPTTERCMFGNTNIPELCAEKVIIPFGKEVNIDYITDMESNDNACDGDNTMYIYFKIYIR